MSTYQRVQEWNEKAGKNPPIKSNEVDVIEFRREVLLNQLSLIEEELHEAYDAVEALDDIEALDAACDLDVVVAGFAYLLDVEDYKGAISAVLDNNDTKFYTGDEIVQMELYKLHLEETTGDEHKVICTVSPSEEDDALFSIHRAFDDKVIKRADHKHVELEQFI